MTPSLLPIVDFVVIVFNEEQNIRACLGAILNQKYEGRLEVTIVNDASTDQTHAILEEMLLHEPKLHVINQTSNQGRGRARLAGIKGTTGSVIAFVDADIVIPSDWLKICVRELESADGAGGIAVPDGDVAVISRMSGALPRAVSGSRILTGNNFVIRRQVLEDFPFPQTPLGEDFRFFTNLERQGIRLSKVEDLIVFHREGKSYSRAIKWLFESGVDAAKLRREFREFRTPDLAALVAGASASLGAALSLITPSALFLPLICVVLIAAAHTLGRFSFLATPFQTAMAFLLDIPLISAYLAGRLKGLILSRVTE